MLRTLHRIALCFSLFAGLTAASTAFAAVPRLDDEAPEQSVSGDWRGGPVSLPIGRGFSQSEILNASFALPQTQELINSFTERGYIRRPEQDRAGSSDTLAFVYLAWQKPGVATTSESPLIRILSKTYFDPDEGRKVTATQAFAGVLRDSSGTLTTYQSGVDAPILIGEVVPSGTPGAVMLDQGRQAQTSGGIISYRVSFHEKMGQVGGFCKDSWKASCPWVRTFSRYAVIGGAAAAGATSALSGNIWAAAGLAVGAAAANQWIEAKWACP